MRRLLLKFHLALGCVIGVGLFVMAAAGLTMVFRTKIDRASHPEFYRVATTGPRLSLDALADRARAAHPAGEFESVRFYTRDDAPVVVRFKDKDTFYLDPHTGEIAAQRNRFAGIFGRAEAIHRFLFLPPDTGEIVSGSVALGLLVLFATGIRLWAPMTWRVLKDTLTLNRALEGRAKFLGLHRAFGIYVGVLAALSAATGLVQDFGWAERTLYRLTFSSPPPAAQKPVALAVDAPRLPLEELARRAAATVPAASETYLPVPSAKAESVKIYLIENSAPHPNARTYVTLDTRTGALLSHIPYATAPTGYRLLYWMISWHVGQLGLANQVVLTIGATGLMALVFTGLRSYLGRRRTAAAVAREVPVEQMLP